MKNIFKRTIELILFIAILVVILLKLSVVVTVFGKDMDNDRTTRLFFELPNNTVDIVFTGDSHIYNSFIPQKIFNEQGYTSAIAATSNQSIINTYWIIEETLKTQKPSIVIMDVHSIEDTYRKKDNYLHFTSGVLSIPDQSINKYLCLKDIEKSNYGISNEIKIEDVVALLQFRNDFERKDFRIKQLFNILINPKQEFKTFGYYPTTTIFKMPDTLDEGSYYDEDIIFEESISYIYLNKIYELCKNKDIDLIITKNLYSSSSTNLNTISKIKEWCKNKGVYFIDYFELVEECGFNYKTDFYNGTHLNYSGAKKATEYLISYLNSGFNLVDHRNDKKYDLWQNNNYDYKELEEEMNKEIRKNN